VLGSARAVRRGPGAPRGSLGARLRDGDVTDVEPVENMAVPEAPAASQPRRESIDARAANSGGTEVQLAQSMTDSGPDCPRVRRLYARMGAAREKWTRVTSAQHGCATPMRRRLTFLKRRMCLMRAAAVAMPVPWPAATTLVLNSSLQRLRRRRSEGIPSSAILFTFLLNR
jgi:hypothetical protein